jgi:CheY-like chemotaxis protein
MIISTSYAEEDGVSIVKELEGKKGWVALHFALKNHIYGSNWDIVPLQTVVNRMGKIFQDTSNIKALFMHDGDIILMLPDLNEEYSLKVQALMEDVFHGSIQETQTYELPDDFEEIQALCEDKNNVWKAWQQKNTNKPTRRKKTKIDAKYAKQLLEERKNRKGVHILLVEDEPFTLKLIEGILQENTIIKATDGEEAVEAYMLNAPDIVFLDINLPGLDGHKVLQQIIAFDPDSYVVMLSGNTLMKDISHALNRGAKGFVVKPFPKEKLLNYVELCKTVKSEKIA